METLRGEDSRNGRTDRSAVERSKNQPPTGFEGMNYEQKRRPYKQLSSNENNTTEENRNGTSSENPGFPGN